MAAERTPPLNTNKFRFFFPLLFTGLIFFVGAIGILFGNALGNKSKIDTSNNSSLENLYAALIALVGPVAGNLIFALSNIIYERNVNQRNVGAYLARLVPIATVVFYSFGITTQLVSSATENSNLSTPAQRGIDAASFTSLAALMTVILAFATKLAKVPMPAAELGQFFAAMTGSSVVGDVVAPMVTSNPWAANAIGSGATLVGTSMAGWMGTAFDGSKTDPTRRPLLQSSSAYNVNVTEDTTTPINNDSKNDPETPPLLHSSPSSYRIDVVEDSTTLINSPSK